jgi:hypothetical protein
MSQRAILVGAEPKPWITGTSEDVLRVWRALINVYGMTNVDIQMMLSLPIAPPDLVPTVGNVWREVYDAFSQSVVGDDILLYIAWHVGRVATNPLYNNTCYVESLDLY